MSVWRRWWPTRELALGAAGVVSFLLVWHVAVAVEIVSPLSVPRPGAALERSAQLLQDGEFRAELLDTMKTWIWAMVLASTFAIPLGILAGSFRSLYEPTSTVVHAGRSVPSTALIPVSILFFGLGTEMKVALACYAIFWPLLLNSLYGVRAVDPLAVMAGRSLGWGQVQILRRIVLPSAAPSIATGARVAGAIALIVTISAELLGASRGVGTVLVKYQGAERPDFVYGGIVIIGILGTIIYRCLSSLERVVTPWSQRHRS